MSAMVSDVASLRASGAAVLSKPDVLKVRWAGIFGSWAVGQQTENSDVDVVAVHEQDDPGVHIPPNTLDLEDVLPRVWGGRKVDIVHVTLGEDLRGYVAVGTLLCCRTFYGSVQDPTIILLRQSAQDILQWGFEHFNGILDDVWQTRNMVLNMSSEL